MNLIILKRESQHWKVEEMRIKSRLLKVESFKKDDKGYENVVIFTQEKENPDLFRSSHSPIKLTKEEIEIKHKRDKVVFLVCV